MHESKPVYIPDTDGIVACFLFTTSPMIARFVNGPTAQLILQVAATVACVVIQPVAVIAHASTYAPPEYIQGRHVCVMLGLWSIRPVLYMIGFD